MHVPLLLLALASTPIIVDTDVGAWCDDALAIAYAAKHPRAELVGVTTVMEGSYRAPVALKVLDVLGRSDVPVFIGARSALGKKGAIANAGKTKQMETVARLGAPKRKSEAQPAVDWMVREVLARPKQITIIAIGPLTNIALALQREPRFKDAVRELVIMGGALDYPEPEWNIKNDIRAAQVVFDSGIPLTMVGLDVTLKCRPTQEQVAALRGAGHTLLADFLAADANDKLWAHHDPLAVAATFDRSVLKLEGMKVRVDAAGNTVATKGGSVQVATGVDAARFSKLLLETLTAARRGAAK